MRDGDDERSVRGADHAACGGDARCDVYQYAVGVLDEAPVCLGPLRRGVEGACRTVQAVRSAIAAAPALPQVPRRCVPMTCCLSGALAGGIRMPWTSW